MSFDFVIGSSSVKKKASAKPKKKKKPPDEVEATKPKPVDYLAMRREQAQARPPLAPGLGGGTSGKNTWCRSDVPSSSGVPRCLWISRVFPFEIRDSEIVLLFALINDFRICLVSIGLSPQSGQEVLM